MSATTGVAWLPWLLFALPGGVLVDRVRLMIAIDAVIVSASTWRVFNRAAVAQAYAEARLAPPRAGAYTWINGRAASAGP